jgi:hypothetical protein
MGATLLIGGERGRLEVLRGLVRELLQTSHLAPNEADDDGSAQLRATNKRSTHT